MAISIDGCITKNQDDSDWVSENDLVEFSSFIQASDAVIMGRRTMEQFGEDFPVQGPLNIVLTKDRKLHRENDKVIFMSGSPKEVVAKAKSLGLENLLLIGGENTNAHFLKDGVIDEIVLSVHPLVIGKGLRLFGDDKYDTSLKLMDVRKISDELVQIRYEVVK